MSLNGRSGRVMAVRLATASTPVRAVLNAVLGNEDDCGQVLAEVSFVGGEHEVRGQ
jgi:hypothetical protein